MLKASIGKQQRSSTRSLPATHWMSPPFWSAGSGARAPARAAHWEAPQPQKTKSDIVSVEAWKEGASEAHSTGKPVKLVMA